MKRFSAYCAPQWGWREPVSLDTSRWCRRRAAKEPSAYPGALRTREGPRPSQATLATRTSEVIVSIANAEAKSINSFDRPYGVKP